MEPAGDDVPYLANQLKNDNKYRNIFEEIVRAQRKFFEISNINRLGGFPVAEWAERIVASDLVKLNPDTLQPEMTDNDQFVIVDDNEVVNYAARKILLLPAINRGEGTPPRRVRRTGTHTRRAVTPPRRREINEIINSLNAAITHFSDNYINPPQRGGRKNKSMKKINKKAKQTRNNRK